MNTAFVIKELDRIVSDLSHEDSFKTVYLPRHGVPMPSVRNLSEGVELLRRILFPGYFGDSSMKPETVKYYLGVNLDKAFNIMLEEVKRGLCFTCDLELHQPCANCERQASELTLNFFRKLPDLRHKLSTDVKAAYDGDPAAKSYGEIIFCYPTIRALTNHRIAHELLLSGVPLIPRIIAEMAHSETGIDIHPGATIGEYFTIDHGTGVVIGETCVIGSNVKLYQGVTLGAKSFPLDEHGNPIKGIPRHPVVEDNVVIYSNATILGRITVGANSMIGGNVWVTADVPPNSKILQRKPREDRYFDGGGI